MNQPLTSLYKYIMCSLLSLLPLAVVGQTAASLASGHWSNSANIREAEGHNGWKGWWNGGLQRSHSGWYLDMPSGFGNLLATNYVDGYSIGPHATIGHFQKDHSRWEIEETIRWAVDRKAWLMKGALRWYSPITQGTVIEMRGGRHTEDFDHNPALSAGHTSMISTLFGYNHAKLLERTEAGLSVMLPLGGGLDLKGNLSWERRREMENSIWHGIFGVRAQDNTPRIRDGRTVHTMKLYEGPIDGDITLLNLQLSYQPHRTLYVYDDMHAYYKSSAPLLQLNADAGVGDWKYLTLGLQVSQTIESASGWCKEYSYLLGAGNTFKDGELGLVDWHHFDASRYWMQPEPELSRFNMLGNYELSTDSHWVELHFEGKGNWFLARHDASSLDVLALHLLSVPGHRLHCEWQYGIESQNARLSLCMNMNGIKVHNFGIVMSVNIDEARKATPIKRK